MEIVHEIKNKPDDWYCDSRDINLENLARDHFSKISKINKLKHFLYFCADNDLNKTSVEDNMKLKKLTETNLSINMKQFTKFYYEHIDA